MVAGLLAALALAAGGEAIATGVAPADGGAVAGADVQPTPCEASSEVGRPFATCFDPWRGVELAGGAGAQDLAASPVVSVGLRWHGQRESVSKTDSTWLLSHHIAPMELRVIDGRLAFTARAYEGIWRRHVPQGAVLLPTTPPITLPFPLDIGLGARLLTYERRGSEGAGWSLETARLSILFDPIASPTARFHLGFGPTAAHRLRSDGRRVTNDITPLTALMLFVNLESRDGLWVLHASGVAGWTFSPESLGRMTFRAQAQAEGSRVLIAVNDQPISIFVRGSVAFDDAGSAARSEWALSAGLSLRLFSAVN